MLTLLMYAAAESGRKQGWLYLTASGDLFVDLVAWWAARTAVAVLPLIIAGGIADTPGVALIILFLPRELWRPVD